MEGRREGQSGVRAKRGESSASMVGKCEPRGFHHANGQAGFISACAPGLPGWEGMPGSRGQPKSGPHPCQLSFLFLMHFQGGHTVPPPPGQKNVFFCTALPAAPRPSAESPHAHMGKLPQVQVRRARGRRAPSAQILRQRVLAHSKTGGASGKKKDSARVVYPNRERPSPSPKNPRPGLSLLPGHTDPTLCCLRTPPHPQGAAHPSMWSVWKRAADLGRGTRLSLPGGNEWSSLQPGLGSTHPGGRQWEAAICWLPVAPSVTVAAPLMPLFQSPRPSARSPRLTDGSQTLLHCPVSPRRPHREPAPTSRGGAEERAAGGGAVVPGRQLHAVAEDHPTGGRDGPTWGLAAAAAPRHGLSRAAPAAGAWPYGRSGPSRFALSRPSLTPSASEPRRPLGFVVAPAPRPHPPPRGIPYVRSLAPQV